MSIILLILIPPMYIPAYVFDFLRKIFRRVTSMESIRIEVENGNTFHSNLSNFFYLLDYRLSDNFWSIFKVHYKNVQFFRNLIVCI